MSTEYDDDDDERQHIHWGMRIRCVSGGGIAAATRTMTEHFATAGEEIRHADDDFVSVHVAAPHTRFSAGAVPCCCLCWLWLVAYSSTVGTVNMISSPAQAHHTRLYHCWVSYTVRIRLERVYVCSTIIAYMRWYVHGTFARLYILTWSSVARCGAVEST